MDGNKNNGASPMSRDDVEGTALVSVEQLQRLVDLMNRSDVSEVEIKQEQGGTRLILRKAPVSESQESHIDSVLNAQLMPQVDPALSALPVETRHIVTSPLVGTFHPWARPKGGTLVAIGDRVKEGQLVATIESLNVINDVEAATAGRVIEILVQDGQAVEYGQPLMTIESSEGA